MYINIANPNHPCDIFHFCQEKKREGVTPSIELNLLETKEEFASQTPKMEMHFKWFQNVLILSHYSSCSLVASPFDPQTNVYSILKIAALPHLQAIKQVYTYPHVDNPSPTASISFANWTSENQKDAVRKLQQFNIPFCFDHLEKIYMLLQKYEEILCHNPTIRYPALFQVIGHYQEENAQTPFAQVSCELEIHTDKKASLIFRKVQKTFIGEGCSKQVWEIFALGKPKLIAYSTALPVKSADKTTIREEECALALKDVSHIAKVYSIFYYRIRVGQYLFDQQIIEMKYYPTDLYDLFISDQPISTHMKLFYSSQIMEAIHNLHAKGIVHRDIKPENFLINKKGVVLADFGLSRHFQDPLFKQERAGSPHYIAPEMLKSESHTYGFALDIWSAGCVLWMLWKNNVYPWYRDANEYHINTAKILDKMTQFENSTTHPKYPIDCLIWQMLRINPEMRWTADKILKILDLLQKKYSLTQAN